MNGKRLGIGIIGSGFNARFHMQAFRAVRDADVLGVWSPNRKNAESAATFARDLDVGKCKPYRSISEMVELVTPTRLASSRWLRPLLLRTACSLTPISKALALPSVAGYLTPHPGPVN